MPQVAEAQTVLKQLIEHNGTRYVFLAAKLGITPGGLTRLLSKERPCRRGIAETLAAFYHVPLDVIYEDHGGLKELLCEGDLRPRTNSAPSQTAEAISPE